MAKYTISADTIRAAIKHRINAFEREILASKMEKADLAYYRKGYNKASIANGDSKAASRKEESDFVTHITPLVAPVVEAEVTFLERTFTSSPEVFSVVSKAADQKLATAVQAINERNAKRSGWKRNLSMFFRDCAKYNLGALEVERRKETTYSLSASADFKSAETSPVNWTGTTLKRIDPLNLFFDTHVLPADVTRDGEHIGKIELITQVKLHQRIKELKVLDPDGVQKEAGTTEMWQSQTTNQYCEPNYQYFDDVMRKDQEIDWSTFGEEGMTAEAKKRGAIKNYEVITAYFRIIPSTWGIKMDNPDLDEEAQIWKFIVVNEQHVIYAAPQEHGHDLLPILLGQPLEDSMGHQAQSSAYQLIDMQDYVSKLSARRIAIIDEALDPTAAYDPNMFNKEDLQNRAVSRKIPMKGRVKENMDIKQFYYPFPSQLAALGPIWQEIREVKLDGQDASGVNKSQQGQFTKGNRTLEEFDSVMSNADGRLLSKAQALHEQVIEPAKQIIKSNIMLYAESEDLVVPSTGEVVNIDPTMLRNALFDFKLADGLNPASTLLNDKSLEAFLQMTAANPQLNQTHDIQKILSHLFLQSKNIDISQYERDQQLPPAGAQDEVVPPAAV
tara:strand:- start:3225 stop:5072 length:1848 start_codon:yes stop_codon:yes gene_type:complete